MTPTSDFMDPPALSYIPESLGKRINTNGDDRTLSTRESALTLLSMGQSLWLEELLDEQMSVMDDAMDQSINQIDTVCSTSWFFLTSHLKDDTHTDRAGYDADHKEKEEDVDDEEDSVLLWHDIPLLEHGRTLLDNTEAKLYRLRSATSSQGEEQTMEQSLGHLAKEPQKRLRKYPHHLFSSTAKTSPLARKRLSFLRPSGRMMAMSSGGSVCSETKSVSSRASFRSRASSRPDALVVMDPVDPRAASTRTLHALQPIKTVAAVPRRIPQL